MWGWNTVDRMTCDARLVTAPRKHTQSCIVDALSFAGSVIHSDTNLTKISLSSSIPDDENWLNLWKTSVISSHLLSFVAECRHNINIKSLDWWSRERPCSSLARWRRTVHGQGSIFSADLGHIQFTAAVDQSRWHHTDCYEKNVSVTGFCHQDSLRASSFCRMIGVYEDHRVRLLMSTDGKFI